MKFVKKSNELEQRVSFEIDGKYVGGTNYDESGWSGMENLENMFESIANILKAEYVVEDDEDEEE